MAPVDIDRGLAAVKKLQGLNAKALSKRIDTEIGPAGMALFNSLAKSQTPDEDEQEIASKVHLMVIAYLMRGELDKKGD